MTQHFFSYSELQFGRFKVFSEVSNPILAARLLSELGDFLKGACGSKCITMLRLARPCECPYKERPFAE